MYFGLFSDITFLTWIKPVTLDITIVFFTVELI